MKSRIFVLSSARVEVVIYSQDANGVYTQILRRKTTIGGAARICLRYSIAPRVEKKV